MAVNINKCRRCDDCDVIRQSKKSYFCGCRKLDNKPVWQVDVCPRQKESEKILEELRKMKLIN